jgi:hypothetical protein
VQLAQGALPPREDVGLADDRRDAGRPDGREFGLEPAGMRGDEGIAGRGVGCVKDCLDNPPLTGQSIEDRGLDPPAEGAPRVEA